MGRMLHSQSFSVECFGPMYYGEDVAFAELFCGMFWPDVLYAVMKVSPIYTSHPLYRALFTALIRRS